MNRDIRMPPNNIEAEQSVLRAVLRDNEALSKAMEFIEGPSLHQML